MGRLKQHVRAVAVDGHRLTTSGSSRQAQHFGAANGADLMQSLTTHDERLRSRLELASRLGAVGADARSLEELFRALYEETARMMDATVFFFALYDEASQTVEVVRQMDRGVEYPGGAFPLGRGFTSEVIRTREPRLVRQWSTKGPPVHLLYGTEAGELVAPQSGVVVPITSGDGVLGVLSTQSYRLDAYDDADVFTLRAIAAQAGLAIKRLRATEQMALERERHTLELEAILAGMNDALLTVDERGAIVRINRAARELLGLDGASLVFGQPLERQRLEQWPATAREVAAALVPVIDALRSGTSVAGVEIELRSGQRRVLSLSGSALRPPNGALQGGVIVFRDVTGQRELERLRDDMFAMAAHDLRTPIAVIRGQAEVLLKRLASGEHSIPAFKKAAKSIVWHADRVAELLTVLLDISCLEAGILSISPSPMNLGALAREVTDGIRSTARHRIQVSADESVVGEWDERRIRQVLMNLLSNALKYSPEGSTVTVSVVKDESSATVSVRDEGVGLDGTELAQLFRRGYRAESARHLSGAGLGLYFGHGIIAAHGGRMWAESLGQGQGSTFWFTLPVQEKPSVARPVEPRA